MIHSRRKAREVVLQGLYWTESTGDPISQTIRTMSIRTNLAPEASKFAIALGQSTWACREKLDGLIEIASQNWALDRISRVDRILLWMALTEIIKFEEIPVKVSMDEAIELAKSYSEEKASVFINGILDTLVRQKEISEKTGLVGGT